MSIFLPSPRARYAAVKRNMLHKRLSSVDLVYGATRHVLKSASEIFQRTRRVPRTARVDLRANAPDVTEAELDERSHRKATIHCRKRLNDGRIDEQASGEREKYSQVVLASHTHTLARLSSLLCGWPTKPTE